MKTLVFSTVAAVAVWGTAAFGQDEGMGMHQGRNGMADGVSHGFVDADGDGVNDLALDADGDGTPNGMDPDYAGSTGMGHGHRGNSDMGHHGFVDEDEDGINDLAQDADGDGTPNGMDPDYALPPGVDSGRGRMGGMMGNAVGTGSTAAGQPAAGTQHSALAQHQAPNTAASKADLQQEGSAKPSRNKGMGRAMRSGNGAHGR